MPAVNRPTFVTDDATEKAVVALHDQAVELRFPSTLQAVVEHLYRDSIVDHGTPTSRIVIASSPRDHFSLQVDQEPPVDNLTLGDLPTFVMEGVVRGLIKDLTSAVALHAGAVTYQGKAVLIAGPSGSGKSSLVAWLISNGFDYLSDEIAFLFADERAVLGLPRALVIKPGAIDKVLALPAYRNAHVVPAGEHFILRPNALQDGNARARQCQLMIFPEFAKGSDLRFESLTPAQAGLRLVGSNLNARNLGADGGFRSIARFSREVPAALLRYGDFSQLNGTLDVLTRFLLEGPLQGPESRRFLSLFAPASAPRKAVATTPAPPVKFDIPAPTPLREPKRLTIGMATYDDYDGVYFTLQALRLYHPEILGDTEFLVIDNHPDGPCAEPLKALEQSTPNYRYVPFTANSGTAASKEQVFTESRSELVLCLDCHVFVVPTALKRLVAYFDANPNTPDLLQGPLLYDDLGSISTHFQPTWRGGMYGCWETDPAGADTEGAPFDIPMQGMGLFSCRRVAWPGFNRNFRGFGGEEGYIHEKFRQRGARTLCLPFLRWIHRFRRPMGLPYVNSWEDRIRNYMIGFRELGLSTSELEQHYQEFLGHIAGPVLEKIKRELESS